MYKVHLDRRWKTIRLLVAVWLTCISMFSVAQIPTDSLPKDPGRISVYSIQNLNFGSIYQGSSGGTVIVSPNGARSVTGSVVAINQGSAVFPAIFELEAPAGVLITIQNGADVPLAGSNGGTMSLHLGTSNPVSPFTSMVAPPGRMQVTIGGTLTVGNSTTSKPGNYNGTFSIIFFQQ